jgi:hypothetical protein
VIVADPPRKAFDAALGLAPIGHFRRDFGQLRALYNVPRKLDR